MDLDILKIKEKLLYCNNPKSMLEAISYAYNLGKAEGSNDVNDDFFIEDLYQYVEGLEGE